MKKLIILTTSIYTMDRESCLDDILSIMKHALGQTCQLEFDALTEKNVLLLNYASSDQISAGDNCSQINQHEFLRALLDNMEQDDYSSLEHEYGLINGKSDLTIDEIIKKSMKLSSLRNGSITVAPDEILFQLQPYKKSWIEKALEKYNLYSGRNNDVIEEHLKFLFTEAKCDEKQCAFFTFYPHLGIYNGPQILPRFVRQDICESLNSCISVETFAKCIEFLFKEIQSQTFPRVCICCVFFKQLRNAISRRWTYDSSNIQSYAFNIFDLEVLHNEKGEQIGMSHRKDIAHDVIASDICDPKLDIFSIRELPFENINIDEDQFNIDKYNITWSS